MVDLLRPGAVTVDLAAEVRRSSSSHGPRQHSLLWQGLAPSRDDDDDDGVGVPVHCMHSPPYYHDILIITTLLHRYDHHATTSL